jgi:prophage tail gpP-like protein
VSQRFASAAQAVLTVDGVAHAGWRALTLARGIEAAAAKAELELAERWVGQSEPRRIRAGAPFTLSLDAETVLKGYLDRIEVRYDATEHLLAASGRDAVADLVDCAAVVDGAHEWRGLKLDEIAARLAAPFGVAVERQVEVGAAFPRFALQPGETAWEALERACRQRAVLAIGDGRGRLLLTRAGLGGPAAGPLVLAGPDGDGNVLAAEAAVDAAELFNPIVVRGQAEGGGGADALYALNPDTGQYELREGSPGTAAARAEARAEGKGRYRPRVIIAENAGAGAQLAERAAWEARVAAGRAERVRYTVPGWRGASGALWQPNTRVEVRDPWVGLERELLIAGVAFELGPQGSRTVLDCAPADAFVLLPEPPKRGAGDGGPTGLFVIEEGGRRRRIGSEAEVLGAAPGGSGAP